IARVILGGRARIGGIEEPVGESTAEIKEHSLVIAVAIVVCVRNGAEAWIDPRRRHAFVVNQVAGISVDVDSVTNDALLVAVANRIVRVRSRITNAGDVSGPEFALQGERPNIGPRRLQVRVYASDREVKPR